MVTVWRAVMVIFPPRWKAGALVTVWQKRDSVGGTSAPDAYWNVTSSPLMSREAVVGPTVPEPLDANPTSVVVSS